MEINPIKPTLRQPMALVVKSFASRRIEQRAGDRAADPVAMFRQIYLDHNSKVITFLPDGDSGKDEQLIPYGDFANVS